MNASICRTQKAFTLIELLIVVAIIAILAAIAVPNFLEARVRAGISRTYGDFRSLATALETYRVDNNRYPIDYGYSERQTWAQLTTPIAYMSTILIDPFISEKDGAVDANSSRDNQPYAYGADSKPVNLWWQGTPYDQHGVGYFLVSPGPDNTYNLPDEPDHHRRLAEGREASANMLYDATNGSKSRGDLVCTNKGIYNQQ